MIIALRHDNVLNYEIMPWVPIPRAEADLVKLRSAHKIVFFLNIICLYYCDFRSLF